MVSTTTDRLAGFSSSEAIKAPCRIATTADITLSAEQTIDGVAVVADDRVLVKNQSDASENGIYVASTSSWARAKDFNGARDAVKGTLISVHSGSTNSDSFWVVSTADGFTIGTSDINFTASNTALAGVSSYMQTVLAATTASSARDLLGAVGSTDASTFSATNTFSALTEFSTGVRIGGRAVFSKGADIASASPLVLGDDGNYFDITGTTNSTAITAGAGEWFMLQFDGALTLTHSTQLDLPGEVNITTAAGDRLIGFAEAANDIQVLSYFKADGSPVAGAASQAEMETATDTTKMVTPGRAQNHPGVAKAWCVFDGLALTTSSGLTGVGANYNVGSVLRIATGQYEVQFVTPFSSTAYVATGTCLSTAAFAVVAQPTAQVKTASQIELSTTNLSGSQVQCEDVTLAFFGDQ